MTVETTGTLLVGAEIAAAATALQALGIDSLGLNCATGPAEMAKHVKWLAENWPGLISVQPNAGLPELVDGQTFYPLAPRELADWHRRFVTEDGVNLIGGCCGTRPEHIAAIDARITSYNVCYTKLLRVGGPPSSPRGTESTIFAATSFA